MFVQISTDNQIKSDAGANARLEERVRTKLQRFEQRLTHVEVHVEDVNGAKGGEADKRVSLEARPAGREPVAVHAEAAAGRDRGHARRRTRRRARSTTRSARTPPLRDCLAR